VRSAGEVILTRERIVQPVAKRNQDKAIQRELHCRKSKNGRRRVKYCVKKKKPWDTAHRPRTRLGVGQVKDHTMGVTVERYSANKPELVTAGKRMEVKGTHVRNERGLEKSFLAKDKLKHFSLDLRRIIEERRDAHIAETERSDNESRYEANRQ